MIKVRKIVFWTSIGFLIFWIITPIVGQFVSLEFNNEKLELSYAQFRFFGVPISILLTLTGTIKSNEKDKGILIKGILTLLIAVFSLFFMFITLFVGMCDWTTNEILYVNKQNENIKIVNRDFGCGATDSEPPVEKVFKIRNFTKYFIYTSEIDTNIIDKSKWRRVNN